MYFRINWDVFRGFIITFFIYKNIYSRNTKYSIFLKLHGGYCQA